MTNSSQMSILYTGGHFCSKFTKRALANYKHLKAEVFHVYKLHEHMLH